MLKAVGGPIITVLTICNVMIVIGLVTVTRRRVMMVRRLVLRKLLSSILLCLTLKKRRFMIGRVLVCPWFDD